MSSQKKDLNQIIGRFFSSFITRENQIHIGSNGIYYRKAIKEKESIFQNRNRKLYYVDNNPQLTGTVLSEKINYSDTIRVDINPVAHSVIRQEISKDIGVPKYYEGVWILVLIISCFVLMLSTYVLLTHLDSVILVVNLSGIILFFGGLFILAFYEIVSWLSLNANLIYDLERDAEFEWRTFYESFSGIGYSGKFLNVVKEIPTYDTKRNAGSSSFVIRNTSHFYIISPYYRAPGKFTTNVPAPVIGSTPYLIIFLPSVILLNKGSQQYMYSYDQIQIVTDFCDMVEAETVPKDAEIIRYTWRFVNKDGSPDRRFNGNMQLPVCRYGIIRIIGSDMNLEFQISNYSISSNIENAYNRYKAFYSNFK